MGLEVIQAGEEGLAALAPPKSGLQLSNEWLIGLEKSPAVIVCCHFSYHDLKYIHVHVYTCIVSTCTDAV